MKKVQLFEDFIIEKGKKPQSVKQKVKGLNKKIKKAFKKKEDLVKKTKEIDAVQKDGEAQPSDKLQKLLIKSQIKGADIDAKKTQAKQQQLVLKAKVKTAKEAEKAKKEAAKESLSLEKLEWQDSDAPKAEGRFRDLSPKDLAAWLIKTRKGDLKKISGSLSQQVAFNQNDDKEYVKKMDKTREEVYKQLGREDLLESILNEAEETYNDYPAAAKKNAQKAIDWKEKYGRDEVDAGTAVGWARAHQLAKGENLSADTVGRMSAFNRHRKNSKIAAEYKGTPWKDRGYVAWLIWGGDEGVDWAIKKMEEIKD